MTVKKEIGDLTDIFNDRRAKGQVRYKGTVHHVDMHPVGSGSFDFFDFVCQISKIGNKIEGATLIIFFRPFPFWILFLLK